ncbi:MAG: helix-turn-helix domain-containing protein [Clostridia bacterium]|nr:helix-turn-helix domain-containing protein [Clostridia bacterium]
MKRLKGGLRMTVTPDGTGHVSWDGARITAAHYEKVGGHHPRPPHYHDFYELELLLAACGQGRQVINGVPFLMRAGSFFLIRPTDLHRYDLPDGCTASVVTLRFGSDSLPAELFAPLSDSAQLIADADPDVLSSIAREALEESTKNDGFTSCALRQIVARLCIMLLRASADEPHAVPRGIPARAAAVIHARYAEPLTVREVAEAVGVSPNYLGQVFLREMNLTAADYIKRVRLVNALHRVSATDEPLGVIALECGFGSPPVFAREFKRYYGVTPTDYRRKTL